MRANSIVWTIGGSSSECGDGDVKCSGDVCGGYYSGDVVVMVVVMINLVVLLDGGGGSRGDYDGECDGDAFGSWVVVLAVVAVVVKMMVVLLAIAGVKMVAVVVVVFNGMCWYGGPFGGCDCGGEGDGVW